MFIKTETFFGYCSFCMDLEDVSCSILHIHRCLEVHLLLVQQFLNLAHFYWFSWFWFRRPCPLSRPLKGLFASLWQSGTLRQFVFIYFIISLNLFWYYNKTYLNQSLKMFAFRYPLSVVPYCQFLGKVFRPTLCGIYLLNIIKVPSRIFPAALKPWTVVIWSVVNTWRTNGLNYKKKLPIPSILLIGFFKIIFYEIHREYVDYFISTILFIC